MVTKQNNNKQNMLKKLTLIALFLTKTSSFEFITNIRSVCKNLKNRWYYGWTMPTADIVICTNGHLSVYNVSKDLPELIYFEADKSYSGAFSSSKYHKTLIPSIDQDSTNSKILDFSGSEMKIIEQTEIPKIKLCREWYKHEQFIICKGWIPQGSNQFGEYTWFDIDIEKNKIVSTKVKKTAPTYTSENRYRNYLFNYTWVNGNTNGLQYLKFSDFVLGFNNSSKIEFVSLYSTKEMDFYEGHLVGCGYKEKPTSVGQNQYLNCYIASLCPKKILKELQFDLFELGVDSRYLSLTASLKWGILIMFQTTQNHKGFSAFSLSDGEKIQGDIDPDYDIEWLRLVNIQRDFPKILLEDDEYVSYVADLDFNPGNGKVKFGPEFKDENCKLGIYKFCFKCVEGFYLWEGTCTKTAHDIECPLFPELEEIVEETQGENMGENNNGENSDNSGDNGSGTGTGDNGSGSGTGDDGSGTGTGDDGSGTGSVDNGSGTGTGDDGSGADTGDNGSGTGDDGSGTGTGDNGSGSGTDTGGNGSGTGTGDDGSGTDTGGIGSGTGNDGSGTDTGGDGSGTGTGDNGTGDDGSGSGTGDNGSGSDTGGNGSGTGTGDDGSGTDTGDNGSGSGTGGNGSGNGSGTDTGENGSGTDTGENGSGTDTGENGSGTGSNGSNTGSEGNGSGDNGSVGNENGTGNNGNSSEGNENNNGNTNNPPSEEEDDTIIIDPSNNIKEDFKTLRATEYYLLDTYHLIIKFRFDGDISALDHINPSTITSILKITPLNSEALNSIKFSLADSYQLHLKKKEIILKLSYLKSSETPLFSLELGTSKITQPSRLLQTSSKSYVEEPITQTNTSELKVPSYYKPGDRFGLIFQLLKVFVYLSLLGCGSFIILIRAFSDNLKKQPKSFWVASTLQSIQITLALFLVDSNFSSQISEFIGDMAVNCLFVKTEMIEDKDHYSDLYGLGANTNNSIEPNPLNQCFPVFALILFLYIMGFLMKKNPTAVDVINNMRKGVYFSFLLPVIFISTASIVVFFKSGFMMNFYNTSGLITIFVYSIAYLWEFCLGRNTKVKNGKKSKYKFSFGKIDFAFDLKKDSSNLNSSVEMLTNIMIIIVIALNRSYDTLQYPLMILSMVVKSIFAMLAKINKNEFPEKKSKFIHRLKIVDVISKMILFVLIFLMKVYNEKSLRIVILLTWIMVAFLFLNLGILTFLTFWRIVNVGCYTQTLDNSERRNSSDQEEVSIFELDNVEGEIISERKKENEDPLDFKNSDKMTRNLNEDSIIKFNKWPIGDGSDSKNTNKNLGIERLESREQLISSGKRSQNNLETIDKTNPIRRKTVGGKKNGNVLKEGTSEIFDTQGKRRKIKAICKNKEAQTDKIKPKRLVEEDEFDFDIEEKKSRKEIDLDSSIVRRKVDEEVAKKIKIEKKKLEKMYKEKIKRYESDFDQKDKKQREKHQKGIEDVQRRIKMLEKKKKEDEKKRKEYEKRKREQEEEVRRKEKDLEKKERNIKLQSIKIRSKLFESDFDFNQNLNMDDDIGKDITKIDRVFIKNYNFNDGGTWIGIMSHDEYNRIKRKRTEEFEEEVKSRRQSVADGEISEQEFKEWKKERGKKLTKEALDIWQINQRRKNRVKEMKKKLKKTKLQLTDRSGEFNDIVSSSDEENEEYYEGNYEMEENDTSIKFKKNKKKNTRLRFKGTLDDGLDGFSSDSDENQNDEQDRILNYRFKENSENFNLGNPEKKKKKVKKVKIKYKAVKNSKNEWGWVEDGTIAPEEDEIEENKVIYYEEMGENDPKWNGKKGIKNKKQRKTFLKEAEKQRIQQRQEILKDYVKLTDGLYERDTDLNQLLFKKNMYDDLSQLEDEELSKMITSRENNLQILEWLKDSLIKDFETEKQTVEDYKSRYRTGKIGNKMERYAKRAGSRIEGFNDLPSQRRTTIIASRIVEENFDEIDENIAELFDGEL